MVLEGVAGKGAPNKYHRVVRIYVLVIKKVPLAAVLELREYQNQIQWVRIIFYYAVLRL